MPRTGIALAPVPKFSLCENGVWCPNDERGLRVRSALVTRHRSSSLWAGLLLRGVDRGSSSHRTGRYVARPAAASPTDCSISSARSLVVMPGGTWLPVRIVPELCFHPGAMELARADALPKEVGVAFIVRVAERGCSTR